MNILIISYSADYANIAYGLLSIYQLVCKCQGMTNKTEFNKIAGFVSLTVKS